jgi:type II secretory pathway component PulL
VLLLIVLILSLGGVFLDIHLLQKQLDSLNDQIKDTFISVFPETSRIVDPVIQMQTKMDELKKKTADAVQTGEKFRCIDILYQISQLIPKETDVLMTRLSIGNDGITITGETAGFNTVDDIKGRLEKSTLFSKVTIAAANMDKSGNKVQFRLKIDL